MNLILDLNQLYIVFVSIKCMYRSWYYLFVTFIIDEWPINTHDFIHEFARICLYTDTTHNTWNNAANGAKGDILRETDRCKYEYNHIGCGVICGMDILLVNCKGIT